MALKKTSIEQNETRIPNPDFESGVLEKYGFVNDDDVKSAIETYKCAANRYNSIDFSDPRLEGILFLERQLAFINLQLALAKARIRNGVEPNLDYTTFETMVKTLLPNVLWMYKPNPEKSLESKSSSIQTGGESIKKQNPEGSGFC